MSKRVSMSDILAIDEFKGLKEFDLLPVEMDNKVLPYLHMLGINKLLGYEVIADQHRNLQNKIVVGYSYIGEMRTCEEFKNSPFCSLEDRIIMTGSKDISLTKELSKLAGGGSSMVEREEEDKDPEDLLTQEYVEDNWEQTTKQITALESIVKFVRGNPYNESGNRKTYLEYTAK